MAPVNYTQPFEIRDAVGNNAFAYDRRGTTPSLWVPSLIHGTFADATCGDRTVFEDVDEHDVLQSCTGLAHLVRTTWRDIPTVIVDNHNHAFYFWCEALALGQITPGATLIHIDQHRDTRVPQRTYDGHTLADAFHYTNFHLNVGNYIVPAQDAGIVGDAQYVTGAAPLDDLSRAATRNKILNIDLDFFAPEMSYIDFGRVTRFIDAHWPTTSLITIATSPFFIDQPLALTMLRRLCADVAGN